MSHANVSSDMSPSTLQTRSIALVLTLALVLSAFTGVAAAETRAGGTVVVAEGETVSGLEAFAGSVVVHGTVEGDLSAAAGDVTISETGRVTGDVNAAAGNVRVAGTVDGSLGTGAGSVVLSEGARVGGDLQVGAGSVRIDGAVDGDVAVGAESIVLGETATVGGSVRYDGDLRDEGADVGGSVVRDDSIVTGPTFVYEEPVVPGFLEGVLSLYAFLLNLVVGALLLLLFPAFSRRVTRRAVDVPLRSGLAGLVTLVAVPLVLVLIALTVIGIPLSVVGVVLFAIVAWAGALYGRVAVGDWLLSYTDVENRWAAFLLGFVVVAVAVRIPFVGGLVELLVLLLGLGALALLAAERRREARSGRSADAEVDAAGTSSS
jgi:cytoskeletal protein CcmA (bactofilin family)